MKCSRAYAAVASVDNQLYVAGGKRLTTDTPPAETISTRVEVYYPWSNTWAYCRNMPTASKVWGAAAAGLNSKLYVIGGYTDVAGTVKTNKLQVYDPTTNLWSAGPSLPANVSSSAAVVLSGKIYVLDGDASATPKKKLYIFDPAGPGGVYWTTIISGTSDFLSGCTLQVMDGKIYAVGGMTALGVASNQVDVFNPATSTWSNIDPTPDMTARYDLASGVIDDKLIAVGGWDGTTVSTKTEAFDKATTPPSWATKSNLPAARRGLGGAAINGTLYVVGGANNDFSAVYRKLYAYLPVQVVVSILDPGFSSTVGVLGQDWMVILRLLYITNDITDVGLVGNTGGAGKAIPGLVVLIPTDEGANPDTNWAQAPNNKFNYVAVNQIGHNMVEVLTTWFVNETTTLGGGWNASIYAAVTVGDAPGTVTDTAGDGYEDDLQALGLMSNVAKADFYINPIADYMKKK
jgi:N-acetylneuraminic acid mutarotase